MTRFQIENTLSGVVLGIYEAETPQGALVVTEVVELAPATAIAAFFDARGDEMIDDDEIATAVAEIGNPDADLPVTKTTETVNDFIANGWEHSERLCEGLNGVVGMTKIVGEHRTPRGMRPSRAYAYIADCGDFRLVYVER